MRLKAAGARAQTAEDFSKTFSTPRRLAVLGASEVASAAAGFCRRDDRASVEDRVQGRASPGLAAIAFAKKAGVAVEALKVGDHAEGRVPRSNFGEGRKIEPAEVHRGEEMPKELAGIYWAKNMYWRAGRPERFVRPVRWLLASPRSENVVPVEFGGKTAGQYHLWTSRPLQATKQSAIHSCRASGV